MDSCNTWLQVLCSQWLKSGLTDITRCTVSSQVMLCQAFTAAVFSSCLFLLCFAFSNWSACWIGFRLGDWCGHLLKERIIKKRSGRGLNSEANLSTPLITGKHLDTGEKVKGLSHETEAFLHTEEVICIPSVLICSWQFEINLIDVQRLFFLLLIHWPKTILSHYCTVQF